MRNLFFGPVGELRNGWKTILFVASYMVATGLLSIPVFILSRALGHDPRTLHPIFNIIPSALAVLGVTAIALFLEKRPIHSVGFWLDRQWVRELFLGILGGILLISLTAVSLRGLGGFHWVANPNGSLLGILVGFGVFLLVGVHEETAFRGYPFQRMVKGMGIWPTQILLGVLFAGVHLSNPGIREAGPALMTVTSLNIALAAILFGLTYLKTQSLALPIGLHLGWNWTMGNLFGFQVSGTSSMHGFWTPVLHDKPTWLTGGPVGLEGSVLCTLFCCLAIGALSLWTAKAPSRKVTVSDELPAIPNDAFMA